ncbi:MAG: hypothetical protein ACRERU_01195 [Methylococcales bacterium]
MLIRTVGQEERPGSFRCMPIVRSLARNESDYKKQLMTCGRDHRDDLDERGTFSEEALAEFTRFFLTSCIDQIMFLESLAQPARLRDRVAIWTEEEIRSGALPLKSGVVLETVLYRGVLPRGDVADILGTSERQVRRVTPALLTGRAGLEQPLRLAFPARLAERWMPGLFPASA